MHRLLTPSGNLFLVGNDAIVRGALEAGVGLAATYPGTPSSEIGDSLAEIAKEAGIYFEYSTNEKVAAEVAAGAAFAGVRSLTAMKHFGLNVACDSIFPIAAHGVKAGMVIVVADDPQGWSSGQSEQDTRMFARTGHMPMLEPSNVQECKDFTKLAFELSELLEIPVFVRTTTRINFGGGIVRLGKIAKPKTKGEFKNTEKWNNLPPKVIKRHAELAEKLKKAAAWAENKKLTQAVNLDSGKTGVIAAGVCFDYAMEALNELQTKAPLLKTGMSWPFPEKQVADFVKKLDAVLVVEELEPVVEYYVKKVAKDANPQLKVHGKNLLPHAGEYRTEIVGLALAKLLGKKYAQPAAVAKAIHRPPILCPGCPHRASFWSAKQAAGSNTVFGGDIGCYLLGIHPPMEIIDFIIAMGASQGITHGIQKASNHKAVTFIGDSTFFHSGVAGVMNTVHNNSNPLLVVLDNRTTAMTGHQPHPGSGKNAMGEPAREIKIDEVLRACGVDAVTTVNCFNVAETTAAMKRVIGSGKLGAVVSRGQCRLLTVRNARKDGVTLPIFEIDQKKCTKCGVCLYKFGCPAIHNDKKKFYIDPDFCWGCSVCSQVCPANAISAKAKK